MGNIIRKNQPSLSYTAIELVIIQVSSLFPLIFLGTLSRKVKTLIALDLLLSVEFEYCIENLSPLT